MQAHWTHSRTPSNCSNISFISRLSEPISELGSFGTLLPPDSLIPAAYNMLPMQQQPPPLHMANAVQFYSEQVRLELRQPSTPDRYFNR